MIKTLSLSKPKLFSWLIVLIIPLTSISLEGQVPEFMNRLSGGRVAQSGFKEVVDFEYVSGWICIKARLNEEEQERRFILDTYSPCLVCEDLLSIPGLDVLDAAKDFGSQFEGTPMKPLFPRFSQIRIGRIVFEDIGAMVMSKASGNAVASLLEDGLIGANLMRHCLWQIDTPILSINGKTVDQLSDEEVRRFKNGDLIFSSEEDQEIAIEILVERKKIPLRFATYELFGDK